MKVRNATVHGDLQLVQYFASQPRKDDVEGGPASAQSVEATRGDGTISQCILGNRGHQSVGSSSADQINQEMIESRREALRQFKQTI
jgi:hypothetical protein